MEAMQAAHAALAETVGAAVLDPENARKIREFVGRGRATGAVLDAKDERMQAQGLLNYWAGRLSTAIRAASRAGGAGGAWRIRFEDALLAEPDPRTVRAAVAAADAWLQSLPEAERELARRVMLRLVRLRPAGTMFDAAPTFRAALYDLNMPDKVNAAIAGLEAAGVVRVRPGERPEMDRVALRSSRLKERDRPEWRTFAGWLGDRLRFREDAIAWDRARRPAGRLAREPRLDEVQKYHDRNELERAFADASRDRQRWRNQWNRVLKWVFLGLAAIILLGWITAGYFYHRAAVANRTLRQKQELTNIRLFVRGLGQLVAAHTPPEQAIAKARWKALLAQFRDDPEDSPFLALNLDELHEGATSQEWPTRLSAGDLAEIRRLRNSLLANDAIYETMRSMRQVSFDMVTLSATKAVAELDAGKPYSEVEPYGREFWTQYWGEMLLVEGPAVEAAMVAFGNVLRDIRAEAEKPDQALTGQIRDLISRNAGDKQQQLVQDLNDFRLNVTSCAKLVDQAGKLGIPEANQQRIQVGLSLIRKEAISRPITDKNLGNELALKLQPLLAALTAEQGQRIPPAD
jgi:hypothetical protein